MAIAPETRERLTKALKDVFTKTKTGQPIVGLQLSKHHRITSAFLTIIKEMGIIEKLDDGKKLYRWNDKIETPQKADYFIKLATKVGETSNEKTTISARNAANARLDKSSKFEARYKGKPKEEVKAELEVPKPVEQESNTFHVFKSSVPEKEEYVEDPKMRAAANAIQLNRQPAEEKTDDNLIHLTKLEQRLIIALIQENDNPYFSRFVENIASRINDDLNFSKTDLRLLLILLTDIKVPYMSEFVEQMSDRIFQKVF